MFKPSFRITPQITSALMQIEACRQAIDELPIDATVLRRLRETAALSTTHFSTQIEGNRLTLPEVRAAIEGGGTISFPTYLCSSYTSTDGAPQQVGTSDSSILLFLILRLLCLR